MRVIAFHAAHAKKSRRRRNYRPFLVLLILMILLGGIGFGISRLLIRPTEKDETGYSVTYIKDLPVYEHFVDQNAIGRIGGKRVIQYVVIHETDNYSAGANAARHDAFIHQNALIEKLSWHYTVDDHEVYHHIPDDEPAYHAGDGMEPNGGNTSGIGVELCVAEDNDYEQTLKNGALLAGYLLWKYDLDMDKLKKHQDFSGKVCPSHLITDNRWNEFYEMVLENYEFFKENGQEN